MNYRDYYNAQLQQASLANGLGGFGGLLGGIAPSITTGTNTDYRLITQNIHWREAFQYEEQAAASPPAPKGPNLAWLDKRIDEIRVAL